MFAKIIIGWLANSMIEKFVSKQCAITVNTTMYVCDTCRLYRPVSVESAQQLAPSDNEMLDYTTASLATSGNHLEETPSAASFVSASSQHSNVPGDLRNQNIEVFKVFLELMYRVRHKKMRKFLVFLLCSFFLYFKQKYQQF